MEVKYLNGSWSTEFREKKFILHKKHVLGVREYSIR